MLFQKKLTMHTTGMHGQHTHKHTHSLMLACTHALGFLHGMELGCYYKTKLIQSNALHTYHDHTYTASL